MLAGCSSKAKDTDNNDKDKGTAAGEVKTGDGVSGKTITLGVLTDMTGVYATLGKSVTQAQQLYVKTERRRRCLRLQGGAHRP